MFDTTPIAYDLEVELKVLSPEEGGPDRPGLISWTLKYGHFCIDGTNGNMSSHWIARFYMPDGNEPLPGETVRAFVIFLDPQIRLVLRLHPGKPFLLCAGATIVGEGKILALLHLQEHAIEHIKRRIEDGDDPLKPYHIEVELTLLTPEEGGRAKGYPFRFRNPNIVFENRVVAFSHFRLKDHEMLNPGQTAHVFVTFNIASSRFQQQKLLTTLRPGQPFLLQEGQSSQVIGKGRILSIWTSPYKDLSLDEQAKKVFDILEQKYIRYKGFTSDAQED